MPLTHLRHSIKLITMPYLLNLRKENPIHPLKLLENMLVNCLTCVKWNCFLSIFQLNFGVSQGSIFLPALFAVYLNDLSNLFTLDLRLITLCQI